MFVSGTAVVTGYRVGAVGGLPGTPESITWIGMAVWKSLLQTISSTHELEKTLVKDATGNDTTAVCCNEGFKATIHLIPADTSVANSLSAAIAQATPPPPCSKVTLSGFVLPWLNSDSWIYFGGATFELTNKSDPASMVLPIEYRTANDLSRVVNA